MGYSFAIGHGSFYVEDGYECVGVEMILLAHAPCDGTPTDFTNNRWPSYTSWSDFVQEVGVTQLSDLLIPTHPGYVRLNETHRKLINDKYDELITQKGLKPEDITDPKDFYLHRIIWLHFWINWALDNCEFPVFDNS